MHFEFLVEGQCELTTLSILMPRIIGEYEHPHTWKIHKHRGIGKLMEDMVSAPNPANNTLLHNLPSKLRAYGATGKKDLVVITLVDLDDRPDCHAFKAQLLRTLEPCTTPPQAIFRIAIEELEAWFLGDSQAIFQAYPDADRKLITSYNYDAPCGTWELLMKAVNPAFFIASLSKRSPRTMEEKLKIARRIAPHMDVERNASPSFQTFRDGIRRWL